MKVISLGMGQKIFEDGSSVRQRQIEYGKLFEEVHLIVFTPRGHEFQEQKLSDNVFLHPTRSKNKILFLFDYFKICKNILQQRGKNGFVVTTQDPFETGIIGLIIKLFYRLPLQVQVHTDFANKYFITHSILNFIRFPLGLFVLSFADSVRVVSERIAKSVHSLSHNVSILPIYTEAKSLELRAKSGDRISILTVARLEKEKDLDTAIRAFKKVLDHGVVAELVIVGDGSQKKNLENLTRNLKIEEKVHFVGWQNDLVEFYQKADIYISTSLYEGYGMSMVEAAEAGLPLVISDAGIANEIFINGQEALVVKPKDVSVFTESLMELARNGEFRKEMGDRAKVAAMQVQLSREDYLSKYAESIRAAFDYHKKGLGLFKTNILARYLVAGFSGAGTQIALLYIFTDVVGVWYLYSSVIAFAGAIVVSFLLQKLWTFGDKEVNRAHHQFIKFFIVALLGLVVNTLLLYLLVDLLGLWYILAQIIVGGIIAIFNFLMYKFFVFNNSPQTPLLH